MNFSSICFLNSTRVYAYILVAVPRLQKTPGTLNQIEANSTILFNSRLLRLYQVLRFAFK